MKLGRMTAAAIAMSLGLGSMAEAGNGSNYIHLTNGQDYFFGTGPTNGAFQGIWTCFNGQNLIAPTLVTDTANAQVGTYAAKICAIHFSVNGSPGGTLGFPTISISSGSGGCKFTQSAGTALNFGLASSGLGAVLVGPINGNIGGVALQAVIANVAFANPAAAPNIIVQLALNLTQLFGSPSTIPVPEGDSMTLWLQESTTQTGAGNRQYWDGSADERNICSGYSFLLSGNGTAIGFSNSWEWSIGVGTLDATMTPAITSVGPGPSSLNAHAGTAFAQNFDQGSGTTTISITGTTPLPATSTLGEFLGFAHYDESNTFGGSQKLVIINLQGLEVTSSATCNTGSPTFLSLPTGGPGGPVLSPIGTAPRSAAKFDNVTSALLSGGFWTAATLHTGIAGGSNVPWFPQGGPISGSTGNTGGFAIPLPALPALVGVQLYTSALTLNGAGTALAPLSNLGHSNTNGHSTLLFP